MNDYLKVYDVTLKTRGPVYIGSGSSLSKKEYIYMERARKIVVPNLKKMYMDLRKMHKEHSYEQYMLEESRIGLYDWIRNEGIDLAYIDKWQDYTLNCEDSFIDKRKLEVMTFIKDAYGKPYVPGSSLKGMLRTVILAEDLVNNESKYNKVRREVEESSRQYSKNKKSYLSRETRNLEVECYNLLDRDEKRNNAVNDIMSGIKVSDSEPLDTNDIILCQKIERHIDGRDKSLNILRECIKPNIEIKFAITIDTSLCDIDDSAIMKAIELFATKYYVNFSRKYQNTFKPLKKSVWLGGGVGFTSKTVINQLCKENGLRVTSKILETLFPDKNFGNNKARHRHDEDVRLGVSPHILKVTKYNGNYYQFGECVFNIKPRIEEFSADADK